MIYFVAIVGILSAVLSAIFWFVAAWIPTPLPLMVLGGVSEITRERIQAQSRYNALAATSAGVAAICQAILMIYPICSN